MRRFIVGAAVLLAFVLGAGVALGVTGTWTTLAGIGATQWQDEVTVEYIHAQGPTKVRVSVVSKAATEADYAYTLMLYLDGVPSGSTTVSWAAGEIPGTRKLYTFTGVSVAGVADMALDVQR